MGRIIAYFMHETERYAAETRMKDFEVTDSYIIGEIDPVDIPALQAAGLIIETLPEQPQVETPGRDWEVLPGVRPRALAETRRRGLAEAPLDLTKPNFYLVQLAGPILEQWRDRLTALQVNLLEYIPRNNYTVKLTPEQVRAVSALPFVQAVRLYGPQDTGQLREATRGLAPPPGQKMLTYEARLHQPVDLPAVLSWLQGKGVTIAGASGRKIRFYLGENDPLAEEFAGLPEVAVMEEYVPPKLHNDVARALLGIDQGSGGGSPTAVIPQTGKGQIVGVADTGLDDSHPDFQGRILGLVALGRPNDATDPHGHGTHVAGSILGSGTASGGTLHGTAPESQLFFQSLLDAAGGLGGLPLDLGDLFEEAYQAGARIHNNSWGAGTSSKYTSNSFEVDDFVARRRDMLIVLSAGNDGQAALRLHSQTGYVDWLTIDSPASSKNALTVGASRSNRTTGGYTALTYGQAWPGDFPDAPIAGENVSGNPEGLAGFSSRGPCDDRRIKPDVVAPGTDIASAKSSRAPLRNYWGPYPGNSRYAFLGGTSMAAPLVAGCAALVRQYYVEDCQHPPSAALLRATLINSTRCLTALDALADHSQLPNFHQGFGSVHMPWAFPNLSEPNLDLAFLDTWQDSSRQFTRNGQRFRFQFSCAGGARLRLCLAWTDLPARALQNNLDLFLQHLPSSQKWVGNADLPAKLTATDPDNNVEIVRLENPPAGDYLIQISANNLLKGPQDFALVVSGELTSPLTQV